MPKERAPEHAKDLGAKVSQAKIFRVKALKEEFRKVKILQGQYNKAQSRIMAQRLVELREEERLGLIEAAELMGMDRAVLWRLEHNETHTPQLHSLVKIADFYGVSLDYVTGRSDERGHYQLREGLNAAKARA